MAAATAAPITAAVLVGTQMVDRGPDGVRPAPDPVHPRSRQRQGPPERRRRRDRGPARGHRARRSEDLSGVGRERRDGRRAGAAGPTSWQACADLRLGNGRDGYDHSPQEEYEFLSSLPDHPAKARARPSVLPAHRQVRVRTEHDYRALVTVIILAYVYDPAGPGRVYRALATIPGLRAAEVRVEAGRGAFALTRRARRTPPGTKCSSTRTPICAGRRSAAPQRQLRVREGDVVTGWARLAVAVVDEKGERP